MSCSLTEPVPADADWLIPSTEARLHEYVAPDVKLVGVYVKVLLLQIGEAETGLLNCGVGFTTTDIV